jgi:outer membrane protein
LYNGLIGKSITTSSKANLSKLQLNTNLDKMKDDIALSLNVANAYLQILFNKEN